MPAFAKPTIDYDYDLDTEIEALRDYPKQPEREDRAIPSKEEGALLVATWNIANLGLQERRDKDHRLITEILGWFDLVAIQEVNDRLVGLRGVQEHLPPHYRTLFSDPGGNDERFVFLYDSRKITPLEEVGEVTLPPTELRHIRLADVEQSFSGFDRNPYLGAFRAHDLAFVLANVHLYFGDDDQTGEGMDRRCLEAYALGRWADLRRRSPNAYTTNILALGDFNLPLREETDRVFQALTKRGLHLPEHSTRVGGSNLSDDAHYDQMAVFAGPMEDAISAMGIFDFDNAVFVDLWGTDPSEKEKASFRSYVKYYLSDHRPLWAQLRL